MPLSGNMGAVNLFLDLSIALNSLEIDKIEKIRGLEGLGWHLIPPQKNLIGYNYPLSVDMDDIKRP